MAKPLSPLLYLVPARGGSKGIPRKNVAQLGGRPLIEWTLEAARGSRYGGRIVVSTDSDEVAAVARVNGAEVPFMRPAALASDTASSFDAVAHGLRWLKEHEGYEPDYLVLLQPTSPLRTSFDIDAALDVAFQNDALAVVSVSEPGCHPYWMKTINAQGKLASFDLEGRVVCRRQDLPPIFGLNGAIYIIKPGVLLEGKTWCPESTHPYVMPPDRSIDVDTPWDLYLADLILRDYNKTRGIAR